LLGFVVGAFGTIVGSGSGFIFAPILLVLYPQEKPATLTAISLTAVFFSAASGSAAYAYQRRIDYRSGLAFAAAALPGSIVGALVDVSSFLGIGGGIIHVPLLVRVLGFPTHIATATSHFVLAIIAGSGAATHVFAGSFAHGHGVRRALALSVGVVLGAQLGARLSLRTSGRAVEVLLGIALLALAARLVFAAL
jgi:uncharacterized protein